MSKKVPSLHDLRQQQAERIFAEIHFPASVENHEPWFSGSSKKGFRDAVSSSQRQWSKVVYLLTDDSPKRAVFSVVFQPNSPIATEAYLDEKELVLP